MATINDRIKERRIAAGLTLAEVAKHIGVQEATVQRYESGAIKQIKYETIVMLARLFHCKPSYLMGWDDKGISVIASELIDAGIKNIMPVEKRAFPMLGEIACGQPIFINEQHEVYVSSDANIQADFVLQAHGDSMIGARIYDGDLVFIRFQSDVNNGEIAAIAINDEATLKRIYKYDHQIVLQSENPIYAPIIITDHDHDDVRIIGKAVYLMTYIK